MTAPPVDRLMVEQCDRESAARIAVSDFDEKLILAGKADNSAFVQAFAAHRHQALLEQAARVDSAQQYAVVALHELSEAKAEIAMLRDIVVSYGDRERMANSHRADWQQAIDRAFERDN